MAEMRTERKWIWIWNIDKEEKWLNEMAANGWALKSVHFITYHFEKTEPSQYIVRCEMHDYDENYIAFLEDTGAEYIGKVTKSLYFRRASELGTFDLFSDIDSKIGHLKRIAKLLSVLTFMNFAVGIVNSLNATHFGWFNIAFASLLTYGLGRIHAKIEVLEEEREIHE